MTRFLISVLVLVAWNCLATTQELPCAAGPRSVRAYSIATTNSIRLVWPTNYLRLELAVSRRAYTNNPAAWAVWEGLYANSNPATVRAAGNYTDTNVTSGVRYEYCVSTLVTNFDCPDIGYGEYGDKPYYSYDYISTGTLVPLKDDRGNLILLVESNLAASIGSELTTLTNDLIGDGYKVYQRNVSGADVWSGASWYNAVTNTKAIIKSYYNTDTNAAWTLFIIGHVPIPYSGLSSPGSHTENYGAHPADWYYADMVGAGWTDTTANDSTATHTNCWNVPGDGKFDQSYLPAMPTFTVGRVDLTNLPAFSKTQVELVRQYLSRNHAWRHKQFTVNDRGLIFTNGLPLVVNSLNASFFGSTTNSDLGRWLSTSTNAATSYLFAASSGSGSFTNDVQLGSTASFAASPFYAVFCKMYGSYYGDWDTAVNADDVLLAPLGNSGYPLTVLYAENWLNMDMLSMGDRAGDEVYAMAANFFPDYSSRYLQRGWIFGGTTNVVTERVNAYVSLMGDPTLRFRVVAPPTNVTVIVDTPDNVIKWGTLSETNVQGYHVYRAPTTNLNNFTRITTAPVTGSFRDTNAASTAYTYMVRTVKLENSANRSYYNASQGILSSSTITNYHVAKTGLDSNPGTAALPFLTIQKGINTAKAGDIVTVEAGTYGENVTSTRSGTAARQITIDGQGVATVWSILFSHQYINFHNFTLAGKASGWWMFMESGGHHCVISNNVFDGAYNTNADRILRWNTPEAGHLPWGTNVASDTLVISNLFKRACGTTVIEMFGDRNTVYGNRLIDGDAVDWLHVWGRTNRIANNVCSNSFVSGIDNNHPDFFQSFGLNGAGARGIIVENNIVEASHGDSQLVMFEGQDCADLRDFTFRNNLFIGVSSKGSIACPEVNFYNNTFIDCSTNPLTAGAVLIYTTATNSTYTNFAYSTGHSGKVLNNIFLNCGGTNTDRGWYVFYTYLTNVQADYNFVAKNNYHAVDVNSLHQSVGDVGGWDIWTWYEPHGVNGGNPLFSDAANGDYRLLTNSPLATAGTNLASVFTTDFFGQARGSTWTIGPFNTVSAISTPPTPPPTPPRTLRVQGKVNYRNGIRFQ